VLAYFALAEFDRALSSVQANSLMASLPQIGRWFEIAGSVVVIVAGSASSVWIYGGLAAIAATYVVLFGVTAIAYRTLFSVRP
jgi:hypothetical protein